MQLTGKQIIESGIVTNYCEKGIQQQGIDLRVSKIFKVGDGMQGVAFLGAGLIPTEGKTVLPKSTPIPTYEKPEGNYYALTPGYYELELMEGCKIPNNAAAYLKTRSSLVRCGAIIQSGQFDAGFETETMGCYLDVRCPIIIEIGARVAQIIVHESEPVENTYDGQWQGDKQRK